MTYVRAWSGWVYVAFVVDVFAQRVMAWHAASTKDVDLVMTPIRMATWQREREGHPVVPGQLIGHADYAEDLVKPRAVRLACV